MTAAVLLLAAALCVAPWRPRAADRVAALPAGAEGSTPLARDSDRPGGRLASKVAARALAAITRRGPTRADTGALAQLVDLLAVALQSGLPVPDALAAVADAVDHSDPASARPLRAAAARMRLGAAPAEAWREVPDAARLAPIAPVLARATDGGGSVLAALGHAADRLRSEADADATARAERAAVMVAGPLGLCFLPAFVCLGVLPVVVGLADGMLPGVLP
ncbi:type II secretion system F family protein [Dietzia maris]|uniref:type II secretion system F family protein n=1 Tax=Dietzia maris TaxID=37915 RepID=UPI00223AA73B|nr:type II secretion system F family protein [Dietzia maris]MCT1434726.1 type II secretion system F family protein [Dietzia maris]MCT1521902.1 type II secretion system F family protein [Dietzia maris]